MQPLHEIHLHWQYGKPYICQWSLFWIKKRVCVFLTCLRFLKKSVLKLLYRTVYSKVRCNLKYRINLTLKPEASNLQMQFSQNINKVSLPALNFGHIHTTQTRYNVCAFCGDTQCSTSDTCHSHYNPVHVHFFPKSLSKAKHSVTCVNLTASAGNMTTATKFCECKSGITGCMDTEEGSKQAVLWPVKMWSFSSTTLLTHKLGFSALSVTKKWCP